MLLRKDMSKLKPVEFKVLRAIATMDKKQRAIAFELGMREFAFKYRLTMLRAYFKHVEDPAQVILRAYFGGYYEGAPVPPNTMTTSLTEAERDIVWLHGLYGGPVSIRRNTGKSINTIKSQARAARIKMHTSATPCLVYRALAWGLLDDKMQDLRDQIAQRRNVSRRSE